MNISQIMSTDVEFLSPSATLAEAAEKMEKLDCGFFPIADDAGERLQGVITDRDIVIRGIARGLDPKKTSVDEVRSNKVLYCFENDGIETAAESMYQQKVSRLIVLSDRDTKRLKGVISLGDITRRSGFNGEELAGYATKGMKANGVAPL